MCYVRYYGNSLHIGVIWDGNGSTILTSHDFAVKLISNPRLSLFGGISLKMLPPFHNDDTDL